MDELPVSHEELEAAESEAGEATPKIMTCSSGPLSLAMVLGSDAAQEYHDSASAELQDNVAVGVSRHASDDLSMEMPLALDARDHVSCTALPSSSEQSTTQHCAVERELSHEVESVGQDWARVSSGIDALRAELQAALAADNRSDDGAEENQAIDPDQAMNPVGASHYLFNGQRFDTLEEVRAAAGATPLTVGGAVDASPKSDMLGGNEPEQELCPQMESAAEDQAVNPANAYFCAADASPKSDLSGGYEPERDLRFRLESAECDSVQSPEELISRPKVMSEDDDVAAARRESADSLLSQESHPESVVESEVLMREDSIQSCVLRRPAVPGNFTRCDSRASEDPWAEFDMSPSQTVMSSQKLLTCGQVVSLPDGALPRDAESVYDTLQALRLETLNTPDKAASQESPPTTLDTANTLEALQRFMDGMEGNSEIIKEEDALYSDIGSQPGGSYSDMTPHRKPVVTADMQRGARVKAVWHGDGAYYDAVISKVNSKNNTVVVDWLRPCPLGDEVLTCVLEAGGDDTMYRTVPLEHVRPLHAASFDDSSIEAQPTPTFNEHRDAERVPVRPRVASRLGLDDDPSAEVAEDEPLSDVAQEEMAIKFPVAGDDSPHPAADESPCGPPPTPQAIVSLDDLENIQEATKTEQEAAVPQERGQRTEVPGAKAMSCGALRRPDEQKGKKPRKSAGTKVAQEAYKWWQNVVATPFTNFSESVAGMFESIQEGENEEEGSEAENEEDDEEEDEEVGKVVDVKDVTASSSTSQPAFEIDWDALTRGGVSSAPPPCAPFRPLPVSHEAYKWLHDAVALPTMRTSKDFATAYQRFKEANDLHMMVHKRPSAEALYNMATCLSLGVDRCITSNGRDVVPRLPPLGLYPPAQLVEMRLDLAIVTLVQALDAGYAEASAFFIDPNLKALRESRQAQVAALAQRVQANSALQAGIPKGGPFGTTLQVNAAAQARMIQGDGYQASQAPATFPRVLSTSSSQSTQSGVMLTQPLGSGSSLGVPASSGSSQPPAAKVLGVHSLPRRRLDSGDGAPRRVLRQAAPMPVRGLAPGAAPANSPASTAAGSSR